MNYSRLIFTIFSAIASILAFAIWSNNNNNNIYVYAQQLYSPSAPPTPLSHLPQQTNNNAGSGNSSNSSSIPIVLRPLAGGTCPSGYHLVSRAVCIKDIAQSVAPQTTSAIQTNNATKSFSIPSPAPASQPNATNPTNNEENFNTKILKSFNEELK
jgi:hypothetical protein